MKTLSAAIAVLLIVTARPAMAQIVIDPSTYAAVAYSPATGKYGYSWDQASRGRAERRAMSECQAADARIVTWTKFGWIVLVIADDNAYGVAEVHGAGATDQDAYKQALAHLRKHSNKKVVTVVYVCSGDYKPRVTKTK